MSATLFDTLAFYVNFDTESRKRWLVSQGHKPKDVDWAMNLHQSYAPWLLKQHKIGQVRQGEDDDKLRERFKSFDEAKRSRKLSGREADLNSYKSYGDFAERLDKLGGIESKRGAAKRLAIQGAQAFPLNDEVTIHKITTPEAATEACRGTDWCVKDPRHSESYLKRGPLWLYERNGVKESLHHYPSHQHMDIHDRHLLSTHLRPKLAELATVTKVHPPLHTEINSWDPREVANVFVEEWRQGRKGAVPEGASQRWHIANVPNLPPDLKQAIMPKRDPDVRKRVAQTLTGLRSGKLQLLKTKKGRISVGRFGRKGQELPRAERTAARRAIFKELERRIFHHPDRYDDRAFKLLIRHPQYRSDWGDRRLLEEILKKPVGHKGVIRYA